MAAETIGWIGVGLCIALFAVGGLIAMLQFQKSQGEVVARLALMPNQSFELPLPPRPGSSYELRLRIGYVIPRFQSSETRAPTVRLEALGAAGVLIQGDYRRQPGMDRNMRRSMRGDQIEVHDTRDLLVLPPSAAAGCTIRGTLLADASPNVQLVSLVAVASRS